MNKEILQSKAHADYISHQKIKTTNPKKIKKWLGEEWELKLNGFKEIFSKYLDLFNKEGKCVGLGARTGQEIAALQELGFKDSIGIDLVPFEPYTIEGDFHDLPFEDGSVSLIYTNAVDHVAKPSLWAAEINRVLKNEGHLLINLQIGMKQDNFSVFNFPEESYVTDLFSEFSTLKNHSIKKNVHAMNWEILLQKPPA